MAVSLLAWVNLCKTATLTAGSSATNLPVQNVSSDNGSSSQAWQSVSGVVSTAGGAIITIAPLTTPNSWDILAVARTNLTAGATVTFTLYNLPSTQVYQSIKTGPVSGYQQVLALPPHTTADYATISFDDPTNPDNFINVPLVFAGSAWFPAVGAGFSSTVGRDATILEATARGGSEYPTLLYQRRRYNCQFDALTNSEVWQFADPMALYGNAGSNVLFIPNVGSAFVSQEMVFGRLKQTADVAYPYQGADRRRWSGSITERL